jgi:GR25 family glycosyltransferase involved in LPS biosynthesis
MTQPPTYVIALKGHRYSEAQLNNCLETAKKYDWQVEVSWAVDGSTITEKTWRDLNLTMTGDGKIGKRPGVQGCFLSHWRLWHKCIELDQQIIVLEHDAIIQTQWQPVDASEKLTKLHTAYKDKENQHTGHWGASTHAYTLIPKQAKNLIDFSKQNGARPTDVLMGDRVVNWRYLDHMMVDRNSYSYSTTVHVDRGR